MSQSRHLAAIMFTDIVGYTALMGNDEQKAFSILNKNRELQKPIIKQFNGKWIKELGDGVMASFDTVSDAICAAIKIMEDCNAARNFQLRIGIHLGEVVFENDDVFGDNVNIASRIQAVAGIGCIYVSEAVQRNISNKKDIITKFIGEETLKNVKEPVRIYEVMTANNSNSSIETKTDTHVENSIAVLPFVNMSNDPDQEYFSDGISEDIINMLAHVPGLKVVGRTSSFSFKGKNLDLRLIGRELNVNHILEGSVRKSGNTLRVSAQLINVADGYQLYSEKFDRELKDIFEIQDEISLDILKAIKIKLFGETKEAVLKRYTDNVEAWELYQKGRFYFHKFDEGGFNKALHYFQEAIKIEPKYAIAYAGMASVLGNQVYFNHVPTKNNLPKIHKAIEKSLQLDSGLAESYMSLGQTKMFQEYKLNEAEAALKKSVELNANDAQARCVYAHCLAILNKIQEANEQAVIANSLEPFSLLNNFFLAAFYIFIGNFEKALQIAKRMIELEPNFFGGHFHAGVALLFLNKPDEAFPELEFAVHLNDSVATLQALGDAYGMMGEASKAREVLEKMKVFETSKSGGNFYIATVYAAIGDFDNAFQYLDKALTEQEGPLVYLKIYSSFNPKFAQDPRAQALLKKLGLPD